MQINTCIQPLDIKLQTLDSIRIHVSLIHVCATVFKASMELQLFALSLLLSALVLYQFSFFSGPQGSPVVDFNDVNVPEILQEHTQEFNKTVIKVTDGVHVAVGFALANSIMLEGRDGLIIVDVTENIKTAAEVLSEFRKISSKPIKAIIYTHHHQDHCYGTMGFIEDEDNPPEIWAHETMPTASNFETPVFMTVRRRGMRQFGTYLRNQGLVNAGIGPFLEFDHNFESFLVMPTNTFSGDRKDLTIAGMEIVLLFVPGESSDQIAVWLPEKRVLLCADDFYKAFPNLYAIRGSKTRDLLQWASSIDKMAELKSEHLVPSHTRPISGEETIHNLFTDYRDAIQFIHDQTCRYMNQGLFPDEIVEKVKLPKGLAANPYLQELYGTVRWSVRGVFQMYMGWFSGDVVDINQPSRVEKAKKIASLVGGPYKLIKAARKALDTEDAQWALELSGYVLQIDSGNRDAQHIRYHSLKHLAGQQTSPVSRNYYLTTIMEEFKVVDNRITAEGRHQAIQKLNMRTILTSMTVIFKPEECQDVNLAGLYYFTDTDEFFHLHIRNSVVRMQEKEVTEWDFKITTTTVVWKDIINEVRSPVGSYITSAIQVEGSLLSLRTFMNCFDRERY